MSATSLYIKNLHYEVNEDMLIQKFQVIGNVEKVDIRRSDDYTNAFVYFENHDDADYVKKNMNNDILKGKPMQISWNVRDPAIQQAKQANIIIKNLDKSIDKKRLERECGCFGKILSIKIPTDENGSKGYGYVNFETESQALEAIHQLHSKKIGRKHVVVEKFKPPGERANFSKADEQSRRSTDNLLNYESSSQSDASERYQGFGVPSSSSTDNLNGHQNRSKVNKRTRYYSSDSSPKQGNDYFLSAEIKDGKKPQFVEKSPTIIDSKLRYLQSMLCGKYKKFCNKKINKTFDSNQAKGRLAAIEEKVILVTTTEASHIKCCELLNNMIQCDSVNVPKTLLGSKITSESVAAKIKKEKLKYLALCLDDQDCTVQIASFNKSDVEKGKKVVADFIETFLCVKIFRCDDKVADFIEKHYSSNLPPVMKVPSGVKIVGEGSEVTKGIKQLKQEQFVQSEVIFQAAKLSQYFPSSKQWTNNRDALENKYNCAIATDQSKINPRTKAPSFLTNICPPAIQYEVRQGDISDEVADAIVIGVSSDFDLAWGKIAPIVSKKAGKNLQRDCSSCPLVSTNCLRVTKGYDLSCKYVFHLVTPTSAQDLTKRVKIVLDEAEKLGITSISFPTIGAGGIGIEAHEVALAMRKAFQEFSEEKSHIRLVKNVNIVVFENTLVPVFRLHAVPDGTDSSSNVPMHSAVSQTYGSGEEEWRVTVTSLSQTINDEVIKNLKQVKSKVIVKEELVDDNIAKFEEHEFYEMEKVADDCDVRIEIDKTPKVTIIGLSENVIRAKEKILYLLHYLVEAMVVAKVYVWKMENAFGIFEPFPLRVSRNINTNYEKLSTGRFEISMRGEKYEINLAKMTYSSCSGQMKNGNIKREAVNSLDTNLPTEWTPMNGEQMKRVPLSSGSPEYAKVLRLFNNSKPYASVQKIERIQNPGLYQGYQVKKTDVEKHMQKSEPFERELFHGTSRDKVDKICSNGFDRGFAGENGTAYGRGVYFAVDSSYSLSYCDRSGLKVMFLALVLTGNYCQGNSSYRCAPPIGFGAAIRQYDSVVDNTSNPKLFVVFKDPSVYPNYLITFQ